MKHNILSQIYAGVGLVLSFMFGLMLSSLLNPLTGPIKWESYMWGFLGIPVLFILVFYANFIFHAKKAKQSKIGWRGWILLSLGYIAMMLTGFWMWYTEMLSSFITMTSSTFVDYESIRLYIMIGHSLVFIPTLLAFGWAHGRKIFFLTLTLILVYMYMYELRTFRGTYCEHLNPMKDTGQELNLEITKEEKKFLTYYTDSKISPSVRARVRCEMNFPLNPFIHNSDRTSMW